MAGEPTAAAKLRNILDEECIPDPAVRMFFRELENLLTPSPWVPGADAVAHGKIAMDLAVDAVRRVAPALYCQGPKLDSPKGFPRLARLRAAKSYYSYLPPDDKEQFLASIRKSESEVEGASSDELRQWIVTHLKTYSGDLNLAHPKGVAWAADSDQFGTPAPSLAEAADVLGVPDLRTQPAGVLFRYERTRVPGQHLPRSLDGLSNPPFAMVLPCDSPHGVTQRLSDGSPGLPETVHGGCNLSRTEFINLEVLT